MSADVTVMANPEYEQLLENLRQLKLGSLVPVLEAHVKRAAKSSVSYQDFLAGLVREAPRTARTAYPRAPSGRLPLPLRQSSGGVRLGGAAHPQPGRGRATGQPALP
jgi:hypothetical protein